jgi:PmbA protein
MYDVSVLGEDVKNAAQALGIAKFDLFGGTTNKCSVKVEKGEQVTAASSFHVTLRVWDERGNVGVANTTDLSREGLSVALSMAKETASFLKPEVLPRFSPECLKPISNIRNSAETMVSIPEMTTALLAAEQKLKAGHPAIQQIPYNGLSQSERTQFYINSEGAVRSQTFSSAVLYLYSRAEESGRKPRSAGWLEAKNSFRQLDVDGLVKNVLERTIRQLNYRKVESGTYPVVFSARAFLDLLGAFSNMFNAQGVLDHRSLSKKESLGTALASEALNLYDDALHPGNVSPVAFDQEGTPTRKVTLLNAGKLESFLHSSTTAERMGCGLTGNGTFGSKINVSSHFYVVEKNPAIANKRDVKDEKKYIFVDEVNSLHAGVSALQGSFSLPFDGYLVENGEWTSIESATVAGDFRELLKSIFGMGDVPETTPSGVCPEIWVESLKVTGEE